MNTPTSMAPHICDQVAAKILPSCEPLMRYNNATTIQEAKIALPPTNGVQLKIAAMVAPGASEEAALTCKCKPMMDGSFDHGPVQATTMAIRTRIGSQPWNTSPAVSPCPSDWAPSAAVTGTPP